MTWKNYYYYKDFDWKYKIFWNYYCFLHSYIFISKWIFNIFCLTIYQRVLILYINICSKISLIDIRRFIVFIVFYCIVSKTKVDVIYFYFEG